MKTKSESTTQTRTKLQSLKSYAPDTFNLVIGSREVSVHVCFKCVYVGVLRCKILEHSKFRENTNKMGEVDSPGILMEPMSLNTCVILIKMYVM